MGEAAEVGALDRDALGVERVDLDHPAEAVRLVAVVLGRVVAFVEASKRTNSSAPLSARCQP
jgi:hypothetical protein